METKIDELLNLMRTAEPMLREFITWKQDEAERERQARLAESESEREFAKWLAQKRAEEAQEARDADELKQHFYGGPAWQKEHLTPKRF